MPVPVFMDPVEMKKFVQSLPERERMQFIIQQVAPTLKVREIQKLTLENLYGLFENYKEATPDSPVSKVVGPFIKEKAGRVGWEKYVLTSPNYRGKYPISTITIYRTSLRIGEKIAKLLEQAPQAIKDSASRDMRGMHLSFINLRDLSLRTLLGANEKAQEGLREMKKSGVGSIPAAFLLLSKMAADIASRDWSQIL